MLEVKDRGWIYSKVDPAIWICQARGANGCKSALTVWEVTSRLFIGFKVCSMRENSHPTVNLAKGPWLGQSWAFDGDLLLLLCFDRHSV